MKDLVHVPNTIEALVLRDAELSAGVRDHVKKAKAASSRRAYEADWRVFEEWCTSMRYPVLPPSDDVVSKFIRAHFDAGRKMKTLSRYVSGITYGFKARGFGWKIPDIIKEQLKGARSDRAGVERITQKTEVTDELLERLVAGAGLTAIRDRALLLVGWTGAFRRSELVSFNVEDVTFTNEGASLYLWKSKTDQAGEGATVAIPFARNVAVCGARALREWLDAAKIDKGPIFRAIRTSGAIRAERLTPQSVALIVKRAVRREGLDPKMFAGHSLRSGFATTAARHDVPLQKIMVQTRHKELRTVREYIRRGNIFEDSGAKGLL